MAVATVQTTQKISTVVDKIYYVIPIFCPNHTKNFYCCRFVVTGFQLPVQTTQKISTVVDTFLFFDSFLSKPHKKFLLL